MTSYVFRIMLLLFIVAGSAAIAPSALTAPADEWGCDDLEAYQSEMLDLISDDQFERMVEIFEIDFDRIRPSQAEELVDIFDDWATGAEDMPDHDIPLAAREYHAVMIDTLSFSAAIFNAYAHGGLFAMLPYVDATESLDIDLDLAYQLGVDRCGEDWPFEENEEDLIL